MVQFQPKVWQAPDPGKASVSVQVQRQKISQCPSSKAIKQKVFSLIWDRISLLVLFEASTDGMRPTTLGSTICLTQSTNLTVNHIQKHPQRNT